MKLNLRHKMGLKVAKALPFSWSWRLLKIPSNRTLARKCGTLVQDFREDLSRLIPYRQGAAGEIIGSEVFSFRNGYSTHWGANLTSRGQLIADLSRQGIGIDKDHFSFGKPHIKKARRIKGTVATLTIEHRSNYFHFLCDAISRLQLIQNLNRSPDYIYVQSNWKYQAEILARLGYKKHQIIDSSRYPFIQADQLLVPSYVSNFSLLSANSTSFLRSRLKSKPSKSFSPQRKVVYISRKDSERRNLLNEKELLDHLSGFGVESVVLSELSVDQQIELFANADILITVTGAGLANLIFSRPSLFLVLITPPNWFGKAALEVIKPLGLDFFNVVLSDYPSNADPFSQHIRLTDQEMESIAQVLS